MALHTLSFTETPDGTDLTNPGGYRITHVFQYQDNEEDNLGQYTHVVQVEDWTHVAPAIEHMLTFPDGSGFTVSVTVTMVNGSDLNIATSPLD